MEKLVDTLLVFIPVLLGVLLVWYLVYITIKMVLQHRKNPFGSNWKEANQKLIAPLQLQAYERITLLVERISPMNLISRIFKPQMNLQQFHKEMIRSVREEYEHNIAQQLYIKPETWELVNNAKESTLRMINEANSKLPEKAGPGDLSRELVEIYLNQKTKLPEAALTKLKKDIQNYLN